MNLTVVLPVILLLITTAANAFHILCVFTVPMSSHDILAGNVVTSLMEGGHAVTWISAFLPKKVINKEMEKILRQIPIWKTFTLVPARNWMPEMKALENLHLITLKNENMTELLQHGTFDAVVTDAVYSDVLAGIAAVLQIPWIIVSGKKVNPQLEHLMDDVRSMGTVPMYPDHYSVPMSIPQKIFNMIRTTSNLIWNNWWRRSHIASQYKKFFTPIAKFRKIPLPSFENALYNVSIVLVNSHPAIGPALSLPPNMIEVGGFHITENPKMEEDLKEIMDESRSGVIYISFGATYDISSCPEFEATNLINYLAQKPYTVLIRQNKPISPTPPNIFIRQWFPQEAVLAHPKLRVFVTSAGMMSMLEAVYHGIPMVVVPIYGDQFANAAKAVADGYAVKVSPSSSFPQELYDAVLDIGLIEKYKYAVQDRSHMFRQQMFSRRAILRHYIEVAITTGGAPHLRTPAHFYVWYQKWMFDVIVYIIVMTIISIIVLRFAIKTYVERKLAKMQIKKDEEIPQRRQSNTGRDNRHSRLKKRT